MRLNTISKCILKGLLLSSLIIPRLRIPIQVWLQKILEGTARYAGFLLAPAEGFGQGFYCPLSKKKKLVYAVFAYF